MWTPWGKSDHVTKICRGINFYSTPSHGGFKVSTKLNKLIPYYMRYDDGWYEEDCAWAIPFVALKEKVDIISNTRYTEAVNTLRDYFWKEYENFFNVILDAGESYGKDEYLFNEIHKNDLIVIAAVGDWHENVPAGMVGVAATTGGKRGGNEPDRYFLVPADEYKNRGKHGFVIDPLNHKEVGKF